MQLNKALLSSNWTIHWENPGAVWRLLTTYICKVIEHTNGVAETSKGTRAMQSGVICVAEFSHCRHFTLIYWWSDIGMNPWIWSSSEQMAWQPSTRVKLRDNPQSTWWAITERLFLKSKWGADSGPLKLEVNNLKGCSYIFHVIF